MKKKRLKSTAGAKCVLSFNRY